MFFKDQTFVSSSRESHRSSSPLLTNAPSSPLAAPIEVSSIGEKTTTKSVDVFALPTVVKMAAPATMPPVDTYRNNLARVVKIYLRGILENDADVRRCYSALYKVSQALLDVAGQPTAAASIFAVVEANAPNVFTALLKSFLSAAS